MKKGKAYMTLQPEDLPPERKPTVLLVDDEPQIIDFLCLGFTYDGFAVTVARTGPEALQSITRQRPDIVILDLMLPGLDGMAVAQHIRQVHDTAIIMLTARDDVEDRVAGLEIGADDYVTKPFAFKELMARVRAVLRRQGKYLGDMLTFQGVTLNPATRLVTRDEGPIDLTPPEFDLLELFLIHPLQALQLHAVMATSWVYDL